MNPKTTTPTGAAAIDAELRAALGEERATAWERSRAPYSPTVRVIRSETGDLAAAVLTTRRPSTAAVKIVDLWHADVESGRSAIEAVIERSAARGDAAVKWERAEGTPIPDLALDLGFTLMRSPYSSAAGTSGVSGLVRWHDAVPHRDAAHREPPYYGQTTLYTCGAVAAMLATEHVGTGGFGGDDFDRDRELAFWRRASNYPACEPIGLAVAVRESLPPQHRVNVHLDTAEPVLLEEYTGFERDFRVELQQESRRQAAELGVPVATDRIAIDDIVRRIAGDEVALLLIDEAPMHGETGPHWVFAHTVFSVDGIDTVCIQDPWISSEVGETWVDTHDLPVAASDLDRMIAWGDEATRGVVFISRA